MTGDNFRDAWPAPAVPRILGVLLPDSPFCAIWPDRLVPLHPLADRVLAGIPCVAVITRALDWNRVLVLAQLLRAGQASAAAQIVAREFVHLPRAQFSGITQEIAL